MAGLFDEFKEHARTLRQDIRTLEKALKNPSTFFGTTLRSAEANTILKNELKDVKNINENIEELLQDMEGSISDNDQLLKQVDVVSEDLNDITKLLEDCGFVFSVESDVSENNENEPKGVAKGNTDDFEISKHSEESAKQHNDLDYLCDNVISEHRTEKILESNEKYLEANNIDLDDIVTPYIPRKSLYSEKKT